LVADEFGAVIEPGRENGGAFLRILFFEEAEKRPVVDSSGL
jgi:hypothetical protein